MEKKLLLTMKLTFFFLVMGLLQVHASLRAQERTVDLDVKNVTLRNVFKELQKQTNLDFFFSNRELDLNTKVTVQAQKADLIEVLNRILGRGYQVEIMEEMVVIKPVTVRNAPEPKTFTLKGIVKDEKGQPLPGVTIIIKGTTVGTATDMDGRYSMTLPANAENIVLIYSFVGMEVKEVAYKGQEEINVALKLAVEEMDEVVITGYQQIAQEKMTGAATTLTAKSLDDRYATNVMDNLEGRVAGLVVYNGKISIRGTSSLYAETSPLLVVDGVPIEGQLEDINPSDIESITVLKDAASAAIYGARASNGIIVIKTKNAKRTGKIEVDFSANVTVHQKKNLDYSDNFYMTPEQQVNAEADYWDYYYFDNGGEIADPIGNTETSIKSTGGNITPIQYAYYQQAIGDMTAADVAALLEKYKKNNFAKEYAEHILQKQILQQYNLAVRSRSERFQSNLTMNYKHDNSGIINNHESAFQVNYKGIYDMTPWLTASFSVNGLFNKSQKSNSAYATDPFMVPAYYKLLNDDGSYNYYGIDCSPYYKEPDENPALRTMRFNHLEEMNYDRTKSDRQHLRYHGDLLFKVIDGLTLNAQFIYETDRKNESSYAEAESYIMRLMRNAYTKKEGDSYSYLIPENGGKLATVDTRGNYWTARGQVNYSKEFGKHAINALAGMEFRETKSWGTKNLLLGYDEQLQNDAMTTVNLHDLQKLEYSPYFMNGKYWANYYLYNTYIQPAIGPVSEVRHRYASGYANVTYTYNDRYNVFASFRKDYADLYGLNVKFRGKPLWSVGAAWNIHHENFIESIEFVDFLKLRASYGVTGNIYQSATSYMTANVTGLNSVTLQPLAEIESPGNPKLKWEKTKTTNIGIDYTLLGNRIRGSFDYYLKQSSDIFSNKTIEPTKGYTSMFMNMADMKNNGVELSLSVDWLRPSNSDKFQWNTSFTFAYNKNKITKVENAATTAKAILLNKYVEGYASSGLFSFRFAGIEDGVHTWYDADGSVKKMVSSSSFEALEYSGQTDPKTSLGIDNSFTYKGFSLSFMMAYYGGHVMRCLVEEWAMGFPRNGAIPGYYANAWTPENPTDHPAIGRHSPTGGSSGGEFLYGNTYIHPADFLKIRNVVLGYNLPLKWVNKIGMQHASLRFQVDNLPAIWKKNKMDVDPETLGLRVPTSFIFGLNINF